MLLSTIPQARQLADRAWPGSKVNVVLVGEQWLIQVDTSSTTYVSYPFTTKHEADIEAKNWMRQKIRTVLEELGPEATNLQVIIMGTQKRLAELNTTRNRLRVALDPLDG